MRKKTGVSMVIHTVVGASNIDVFPESAEISGRGEMGRLADFLSCQCFWLASFQNDIRIFAQYMNVVESHSARRSRLEAST